MSTSFGTWQLHFGYTLLSGNPSQDNDTPCVVILYHNCDYNRAYRFPHYFVSILLLGFLVGILILLKLKLRWLVDKIIFNIFTRGIRNWNLNFYLRSDI